MKYGLDIRPDGALDFLVAGRAGPPPGPGHHPVPQGDRVRRSTSAAASSTSPPTWPTASGLQTGIATAMVDYPIGDLIAERVRAMGVKPFYKRFKHDGVARPEHGHRLQRPRPRRARAGRLLQPLQRGGGASSSPATSTGRRSSPAACAGSTAAASSRRCRRRRREVIIEGMQAAKAAGAVVSFDLNFREKLWNISGGAEHARSRSSAASSRTSTSWSATRRTCRRGSASPGPRSRPSRKLDPSAFFGMIDRVVKKHPQVKVVATTLREVHSTNRHRWSAVAWIDGKTYVAPTVRAGRLRPRRRRRRLRVRLLLRPARGRVARGGGQARLGARRAADHVPGRHHDGDRGAGAGLRQGRLGPHPALGARGDHRDEQGRHRPDRAGRDGREPDPQHGEPRLHRRGLQPHTSTRWTSS